MNSTTLPATDGELIRRLDELETVTRTETKTDPPLTRSSTSSTGVYGRRQPVSPAAEYPCPDSPGL